MAALIIEGIDNEDVGNIREITLYHDDTVIEGMVDEMKLEVFLENMEKKSLQEIEKFFGV